MEKAAEVTKIIEAVEAYRGETPSNKRIIRYLYRMSATCTEVFPSVAYIMKGTGLSRTTVQNFIRKQAALCVEGKESFLILNVYKKFDGTYTLFAEKNKNKGQTSNQYIINNNFKQGLIWLESKGLLRKNKRQLSNVISSMKIEPPPPQNLSPIKDSYYKEYKDTSYISSKKAEEVPKFTEKPKRDPGKEEVKISFHLKDCKIDTHTKSYISRNFSESVIVATLSDARWFSKKQSVREPGGLFVYLAKLNKQKLQGAKL